ncbi:DNA/RNA helicase, superfamily I [Frankia casuarinae]|uniref:DNA 3'-5' helicase n=1 Tax=Frankia casuarinae (strain DSM 45818 / CECT 9043 / HFP020203 / CcI3) TaxID=106370 RepID=Q2J6J7_FRACC|nr:MULTISPECIES: UvrD-helicase domain-containing protein [Frankia]ABD13095.1 UvrD/REP helicase [Frankia casuarinae]ETA00510.1 DNA/RNA helicase, superfamily I [Frankia sp. CcI6]EYT91254.1 DNA/RNA helicase, superfamily I [Frankia casuarinae]KDA41807.1 DNA/RNA helicase, superfamily I [Frankia sp. BMG5.23]OAA21692.1 TIGR00375 family protein [Frankia casuarinae]
MRSRFYADVHIHSRYSRACSRDCDLEHLAWWAARKGIAVVGTGDFTHPAWSQEIATKLVPAEPGLFRLRSDLEHEVLRTLPASCRTATRFMISSEISTIYKRGDRTRKVHHLLYAPDREAAGRITAALARIGNLAADGRPILGLDSRDLLEITLGGGAGCYLVPAHVWTPWFAVLGSKSGFDAVEDCYGDLADEVFALETGLSADPEMFWRISGLDRYRLVSNSDAHSPPMLGREATAFTCDLDYFSIEAALRGGDGFAGTVEFFPEEGKYHLDGHRKCGVVLTPDQTREVGGRCPTCGGGLTVGVLNRVEALADRRPGHRPVTAPDVTSLVPLPEVVGEILGVGPKSKAVAGQVTSLVSRLGPELDILGDVPLTDIAGVGSPELVEAISRLRRGEVIRQAGFDGEYGVIRLFEPRELARDGGTLFDLGSGAAGGQDRIDAGPSLDEALAARARPAPDAAVVPGDAAVADSQLFTPVSGDTPSVLDGLDPEQRLAASHLSGPLLVLAGPGTGKTRTLVHAIAHRVAEHGVPAGECLAVTFTRRAAGELAERLAGLLGDAAGRVLATTFHGLGLTIIREQHAKLARGPQVQVADDAVRVELIAAALHGEGDARTRRRVAAGVAELKRHRALGQAIRDHDLVGALARYDAALRDRDMVDLDDLITLPLTLLRSSPDLAEHYQRRWRHVWVDEYQDTDELQYRLLGLLCPPTANLCVIGDPDQAIYSFRGADVRFFLRFEQDYPSARPVALTRGYRSTRTIVRTALDVIAPTSLVPDRTLTAVRGAEGDGPVLLRRYRSEAEEAIAVVDTIDAALGGTSFHALDSGVDGSVDAGFSFADIAVLYRTARQAEPIMEALATRGFPFQRRSHLPLADAPAVADLLALLQDLTTTDPSGPGVPRPVSGLLRDAAARATDLAEARRSELGAVPSDGFPGFSGGRVPTEAELRLAVELLAPAAAAAGNDLAGFLTSVTLAAEVDGLDPRADRISLLTLHASKGLEYGLVIIVGCEDGLLPMRFGPAGEAPGGGIPGGGVNGTADGTADAGTKDAEAEERRLFFVGVTRARHRLVLTSAASRRRAGSVVTTRPSPFLADIRPALLSSVPAEGVPAEGGRRRSRRPAPGKQLRLL